MSTFGKFYLDIIFPRTKCCFLGLIIGINCKWILRHTIGATINKLIFSIAILHELRIDSSIILPFRHGILHVSVYFSII